jgi:outer membrane protein assembly factor BamB
LRFRANTSILADELDLGLISGVHSMILSCAKFRLLVTTSFIMSLAVLVPSDSAIAVLEKAKKEPRSWSMFGGSPSRNMVNLVERGLVADWCVEDGKLKNIRWMVEFGGKTFGSPVVADGKVFVATGIKNGALLMAYREGDGKLLWQNTHQTAEDWSSEFRGAPSNPTVDDRNLFYVTPSCEVICAGVDKGDIIWRYDMKNEHRVFPGVGFCAFTPSQASPLVVGDFVFITTGNGRDDDDKLPSPRAPSFIALHKKTGRLAWQSSLPGENIIQGQWSSPTYARVNHEPQAIFAGGDCVVYSFEPHTGKLLWKCDCLPQRRKMDDRHKDLYIVGTPVIAGDRLYVGLGMALESPWAANESSYFLCLDITKKGDVSLKSYDAKAVENKNSALVWAFGGRTDPAKKGPRFYFGKTVSTAAVHDGLVYIPEENGYLHCMDASTGRGVWVHDTRTAIHGSAYWVDGRVFLGAEEEIMIFAHGRTAKLLTTIDMDDTVLTTPVAANGVIYLATRGKLYAIGAP